MTLCITILKKLKYLHDRNVILGDINPNNILVVSPTEVYFVDTDSYQIEGFPCPVGTINFTAPEIQRKDFSTFLRTIGNERFAVANAAVHDHAARQAAVLPAGRRKPG